MSAPFSVLFLLLTFGLIARLTRLLVDDTLTAGIRLRVQKRIYPGGKMVDTEIDPLSRRVTKQQWQENPKTAKHKLAGFLALVLDCSWCTSVWVAAATTITASYSTHHSHLLTAYWWTAAAGTASFLTGAASVWLYSKES